MISKSRQKLIHSLSSKKHRELEMSFLAEGPKIVGELLAYFPCRYLAARREWLETVDFPSAFSAIVDEVSSDELAKISLLKTPQQVLAIFEKPKQTEASLLAPENELCLALDDIQDPGNLGTIIRIADWFGIQTIFCSQGTVDAFNPKTIQATMGAIARVKLHYDDLKKVISSQKADTPIYGTLLDGKDIYSTELENRGIIVMGNEGNGISLDLRAMLTHKLYIPAYPEGRETSESLNVAVATAITCAEFRRIKH